MMINLFYTNLSLAYKLGRIASRFYRRVDPDDLQQGALIGLWHAAKDFDPTLGVKFTTYAYRRIRTEINDTVRWLLYRGKGGWFRKVKHCEISDNDCIYTHVDIIEDRDEYDWLRHAIDNLYVNDSRTREVLRLRMLGMTYPQIAAHFDVTQERIYQLRKHGTHLMHNVYVV